MFPGGNEEKNKLAARKTKFQLELEKIAAQSESHQARRSCFAKRQNLIRHAEACDEHIGDGTCPRFFCVATEAVSKCNKWKSTSSFSNHI